MRPEALQRIEAYIAGREIVGPTNDTIHEIYTSQGRKVILMSDLKELVEAYEEANALVVFSQGN